MVKKFDSEKPKISLAGTLDYLNITEKDLDKICEAFREKRPELWNKTNKDWELKHAVYKNSFKVLAISHGHESNASLMIDGELIASAVEERFTKQKCQMGYPKNAINFCLKYSNINPNDLDSITIVSKNDMMQQTLVGRIDTFSIKDFLSEQYDYWKPIYQNKKVDYQNFQHRINLKQNFDFREFMKKRKN